VSFPHYLTFSNNLFIKNENHIHPEVTELYIELHGKQDGVVAKTFEKESTCKSSAEQEVEELEKIREYHNDKLKPLIKTWISNYSGVDFSPELEKTVEDPLARLGILSIVMCLMDSKIFEETVTKIDADEQQGQKLEKRKYAFNKDTLIEINEIASKEFFSVLEQNRSLEQGLV
jgi:hypothetical protein